MEDINKFFVELEALYKKYNISISHDDCHGEFVIENYNESNLSWIKSALDKRKE